MNTAILENKKFKLQFCNLIRFNNKSEDKNIKIINYEVIY